MPSDVQNPAVVRLCTTTLEKILLIFDTPGQERYNSKIHRIQGSELLLRGHLQVTQRVADGAAQKNIYKHHNSLRVAFWHGSCKNVGIDEDTNG